MGSSHIFTTRLVFTFKCGVFFYYLCLHDTSFVFNCVSKCIWNTLNTNKYMYACTSIKYIYFAFNDLD
jgi:hypothetical protein